VARLEAPDTISAQKRALRREVLARRNATTAAQRGAWSLAITERVLALPEWEGAECLAAFLPFRSEVDTRPIVAAALREGVRIIAPRVSRERHYMEWYELPSLAEELLAPGVWDIPEPRPDRCRLADLTEADAILCPGVAFDEQGGRMGYGGGHYDAALASLCDPEVRVVVVAFELQIVPHVPRDEGDVLIPLIVTEKRVIRA
jgi:5-formyltetrahydrofolate cyclo-ligase